MHDKLIQKLEILSDAAKYDASCASGTAGKRKAGKTDKAGIGSLTGGTGICHSFTPDGRCVSLLKILMTNYCIYDCHYCINRVSSSVQRARFTVKETVELTLNFYKRNYIEGLFLSSGIVGSPDLTMESMVRIAKSLRVDHGFKGYIHLKTIPNASPELQAEAGLYADRLSINVEMPTQPSLNQYAPEKDLGAIHSAMNTLKDKITEHKVDKTHTGKRPPRFAPGGQSTQMIIGADGSNDKTILGASVQLYSQQKLRRVYYSAFSPIPDASEVLPLKPAPLVREHRLYQADWLLRFYGFTLDEIVHDDMLDMDHDPKLAWALRNRHVFPIDLNKADKLMLLRVPGLGARTVQKILAIRRYTKLSWMDLTKMRLPLQKLKPFISVSDYSPAIHLLDSNNFELQFKPPKQFELFGA
ncbi:putative DNA modification/repair radical SAM protein [Alteromonas stellipolaris]|jgi:putative DNA modification/repair radical SAM protein|uniref:putative DNA modification/repair radical SAM protein n=1 Tax=Alteromonas stellipolaris TaxID=233316 RepID=UPI0021177B9C|nr:putative DNA modification/repair radical SAM protein [Alteromonas stellipolaris]MCQ8848254.1 putative DNA modification/repair radical SAM protein [Alteromonas stellipolaris]